MAKQKRKDHPKGKKKTAAAAAAAAMLTKPQQKEVNDNEEKADKVTWEDIAAMSDSDDDDDDDNDTGIEGNEKAKSLRKAITEGKFDGLLSKLKKQKGGDVDSSDEEDEEFEEDDLDGSSSDDDDEDEDKGGEVLEGEPTDLNNEEEKEIEEDDPDYGSKVDDARVKSLSRPTTNDDEDTEEEEDEEDGDRDEKEGSDEEELDGDKQTEKFNRLQATNSTNSKALGIVTAELAVTHSKLPWAETFVIVPSTPLPFGENGDSESNPLDIRDDLKREVAFYNTALEAVHQARAKCEEAGIPFSRPDDFFAEMVKTDDHMAKVKDRLIFETKKIEAVAQRKFSKEQKLRAKESQANRLAEKSKRKREHFQQVEEWANSVAKQRGSALRDDMDDQYLGGRNNKKGPNKKRQAADRKFGFGGKRGRFKQNDRQSMNDVSGFNPRGGFAGGMKKVSAASKSGSGATRQGKRARDAKRARR